MGTLMLAFATPGEKYFSDFLLYALADFLLTEGNSDVKAADAYYIFFDLTVLSNLLFPALSFLAVGGILLLITNMQVFTLFYNTQISTFS